MAAQKKEEDATIYTNCLEWWKDNSYNFPLLSALAIPATHSDVIQHGISTQEDTKQTGSVQALVGTDRQVEDVDRRQCVVALSKPVLRFPRVRRGTDLRRHSSDERCWGKSRRGNGNTRNSLPRIDHVDCIVQSSCYIT